MAKFEVRETITLWLINSYERALEEAFKAHSCTPSDREDGGREQGSDTSSDITDSIRHQRGRI